MANKIDNLFKSAVVEKRNVLNEIRKNNMSLQELRFFSIYLSKINARDVSTRVVRFSLEDFRKIMELGNDMNITHFRSVIRHLLQQIVEVPNESGYGYSAFQLFKKCTLDKDEYGEWYVTIDAHDDALPLMFDFKNRYFTYELWNALQLKSINQIRMYEILKQYETIGKREIPVAELRELLGIAPNEYTRWERFRVRVLDSCQQALAEYTDITYTYEKGKSGQGGKWLTIIFHISKNSKCVDKLLLDEFIKQQDTEEQITFSNIDDENFLREVAEVCHNEFSKEQMELIISLIDFVEETQRLSYLKRVYAMLEYQESKKCKSGNKISDRFLYLKKIIESDCKNYFEKQKNKSEENSEVSYDLETYENSSIFDE